MEATATSSVEALQPSVTVDAVAPVCTTPLGAEGGVVSGAPMTTAL